MHKREFIKKAGLLTSAALAVPFTVSSEKTGNEVKPDQHSFLKGNGASMGLVIGSDHAGFLLKGPLIGALQDWNYNVKDVGCFSTDPVDFPDIALLLVKEILAGNVDKGIMVCGTGVGASIACNKIKGIRAALCHDSYSAHQCVEHDNVNVVCIGAQIIGVKLAEEILHNFLNAKFSTEEQFRRRVQKLDNFDIVTPIETKF